LRQHHDEIVKRGAKVVVLGPDKAAAFEKRWQSEGFPFVGLPDPEHSVLELYGQQVKLLRLGRLPAQVLVDRGGIVRFAHYGSSMSDIPEPQEIIRSLDVLNANAATAAS
jgi:peroxiredoxin Q/BCP